MTQKSNGGSASRSVTEVLKWIGPDSIEPRSTLLAVCPISPAIVDANLITAARAHTSAIFTATLNQVDTDRGYTGWTPKTFSEFVHARRDQLAPATQVVFCLDHGGPWKKDLHASQGWSFGQTSMAVRRSIEACIHAGYVWVHLDATFDLELASQVLPVDVMAERTAQLIEHAERVRADMRSPSVIYEVGVEESHGGDQTVDRLGRFLAALNALLNSRGLPAPTFAVCDLGTRLDGSTLDTNRAQRAVKVAKHHGALIKAHYSDDIAQPGLYPRVGIGAANVGPGLAARELDILTDLQNACSLRGRKVELAEAVFRSLDSGGRWRKWLPDDERAAGLDDLSETTRRWLLRTGARYVLQSDEVVAVRSQLAMAVADCLDTDLEARVREHLAAELDRLYQHFNLVDFGHFADTERQG